MSGEGEVDDEEFCPDCTVGLDSASHYDCPNGPWSNQPTGEPR